MKGQQTPFSIDSRLQSHVYNPKTKAKAAISTRDSPLGKFLAVQASFSRKIREIRMGYPRSYELGVLLYILTAYMKVIDIVIYRTWALALWVGSSSRHLVPTERWDWKLPTLHKPLMIIILFSKYSPKSTVTPLRLELTVNVRGTC